MSKTTLRYVRATDPDVDRKNRSYAVRTRIAEIVGAREHQDFSTDVEVLVERAGHIVAERLTGTVNAGFRGIEGSFVSNVTGRRIPGTRSLGYVVAVANADEWEYLR